LIDDYKRTRKMVVLRGERNAHLQIQNLLMFILNPQKCPEKKQLERVAISGPVGGGGRLPASYTA